jgi:hypothetical protein
MRMMRNWGIKTLVLAVFVLSGGASTSLAAVPPPPVNQNLGIDDGVFNNLNEAECRVCHEDSSITGDTSNVDRHHLRMGTIVPDPNSAPNGDPGDTFECLTCHTLIWNPVTQAYEFDEFRDCTVCHAQIPGEASVHHLTATAQGGHCVACHGDFVNDFDDGHFIPSYDPSLVTPWPSGKPNAGPNGEGNCNFCHDTGTGTSDPGIDPGTGVLVYRNAETHHLTGFVLDGAKCTWCHNVLPPWSELAIRGCEQCHGISSLHNIQFDNVGDGIDPGNEDAYYGHIGHDDDCFGCHGFTSGASVPESGPVIPSVDGLSAYTMVAGTDTAITITGSSFINQMLNPITGQNDITLDCDVRLTDAAGNTTTVEPTAVSPDTIEVILPGSLARGNYKLAALKDPKASNPVRIAVTPPVVIGSATCSGGTVAIRGSGFSGYVDATDSGTSVTSVIGGDAETGSVVSWSDSRIVADFSNCGDTVEVSSVFGTATAGISPAAACSTASVVGMESGSTSDIGNFLYFLLIPIGSVLLWKRLGRRN